MAVPELIDDAKANEYVEIIKSIDEGTMNGIETFQQWYDTLADGDKWIAEYAQSTKGQIRSVDGVIKANKEAHASSVSYNNALKQQTAGAKAAALGMKALSIAGNMLLAWGISEAISFTVKKIDEFANAAKYAKEKADALSSSLAESQNKYSEDSKTISELASKYETLSEGVSDLGYNISLSSSQYNEYKSIVQQLSDIMPNLTTRFNEQGEAIGFVGGKLEDTIKKYQEYQKYQAVDWLVHGDDDGNTYQDAIDNLNEQLKEEHDDFKTSLTTKESINMLQEIIDEYNKYNNSDDAQEAVKNFVLNNYDAVMGKKAGRNSEYLKTIGKNPKEIDGMKPEEFDEFIEELIEKKEKFQQEYDQSAKTISQAMTKVAFAKDEYWNDLDSSGREKVNNILSGITTDFLKNNGLTTEEAQRAFVQKLIDSISKNKGGISDALGNLFELNVEDMNVDDARTKIEQFCGIIAKVLKISLEEAKGLFGFEDFFDTASDYDRVVAYASNGNYKTAKGVKDSKGFDQKAVVEAMNDNGINTTEEIDKWKEILETVNTLDEAIQKYKAQTESANKTTNLTFKEAWKSLKSVGENKKDLTKELLDLAKAGKLTPEVLESNEQYAELLKSVGNSAEIAADKINKMVEASDQLSSMKSGIGAISNVLAEKKDNLSHKKTKEVGIGADKLASFDAEIKGLDSWKEFEETLGNGKKSMEDCQKVANKLATEWVNSNNFLAKLNGTNEDYYRSTLREMGVENADEVVTDALARKKAELNAEKEWAKATTIDLADATVQEINQLVSEKKWSGETKNALYALALEKATVNGNTLDFSSDIDSIISFAEKLGYASSALQTFNAIKSGKYGTGGMPSNVVDIYRKKAQEEYDKMLEKLKEPTKVKVNPTPVSSGSGGSGSKNKGGSQKTKKEKQQFDWLERRLTRMQNIIDLTASKLQNLFSVKAKNKNLDKQIKQTTKLLKQYKAAANIYQDKADEIAKGSTKKTKKGKKKKVKGLSKSIIKKIKSGKVTKANYKKLFKGYNESTYNKISQYIDFYDKAQNAKKRVNELTADIHEKTIQKLTNLQEEQDKYAEQYNAEQQNAVLSKRNEYVTKELNAIKKSYDYQIAIAKENEDLIEQAKLKAEKEREIAEAYQQQVDNIKALYDAKRNALDTGIVNSGNGSRRTYGEQYYKNQVELIESRGLTVGASWYLKQNEIERKKISESNAERNELIKKLQNFKEGTREWYDLQSDIAECENSIVESQKAINDNSAAVRELKNVINEKKAKYLDDLSNEISFIAGLKHGENTDSDTGTFTDKGNLSAYAEALNTVIGKEGAKQFGEDLQKIEDLYSRKASKAEWEKAGFYGYFNDDGSLNIKAVEEDIDELRKKHQDYIQLQFDSEEKLIDLAKEKYEAQKKYLQDIIQAKKEALDIEKDLYDYERNIADKTKNVANLQKQINALQGDDSEEGRARLAKLQVSLDDAQKDLQDTEYERYISDQQKMLDNLMSEYEDLITNLMKDTDAILLDMLNYIQSGKGNMGDLLFDTAKKYGYVTTDNLLDVVNALSGKEYNIVEDVNGNKHISEVIKAQLNNAGNGSSNTNTSSAPSASTNSNANSKNFIIPQGKDEASKEKERKAVQIRKILAPMVSGMGTSGYWTKAKGKPSSYTNQRILDSNIKKGYVLTESGARAVANTLRGDNGFSFKSGENLTKKTKAQIFSALNTYFKASSFATGGIVDYKPNGEDGLAWVRNGEALVPSEKWEQLASLLDVTPDMKRITDSLVKMPEINHSKAFMEQSIGNVEFTFNMPNVTDPNSFLKEVQSNQKLQKALQEVTLGQTNGNGRLSVNRIR